MAKKLITVLGTGEYEKCSYYSTNSLNKEKECFESSFIQESILNIFCKDWSKDNGDEVIVFLTEKARLFNYEETSKGKEKLKSILSKYDVGVKEVDIEDGKNSNELWSIFNSFLENLEDEDEIIFDITHSLRNIPMQIMVAMNYAKTIKNIKILGFYYGAFEVGYNDNEKKYVPIFDLSVFNELMEWTNAVNFFIKYGASKNLSELYEVKRKEAAKKGNYEINTLRSVISNLENFTNCINTCRGQVFKGKNATTKSIYVAFNNLKKSLGALQKDQIDIVKPLKPLFKKIEEKIELFNNKDNFGVSLATVKWCIEHNLTQQGYTAIDETLKTYICKYYGLNEDSFNDREEIANKVLTVYRKEEIKWAVDSKLKNNIKEIIDLIKTNEPKLLIISEKIRIKRNDLNHYGYRGEQTTGCEKFNNELENCFIDLLEVLKNRGESFNE